MAESENELWEIITAVLNGKATEEEKQTLNTWMAEDEKNRQTFLYLSKLRYSGNANGADLSRDRLYWKLRQKINDEKHRKSILLWRYIAAASVAVMISLGCWSYFHADFRPGTETIAESRTLSGIRSRLTLADGTVVFLNAGSSLSYPVQFTGKTRQVTLKGEAYFEVAKDKTHPFIVAAGDVAIRVLGTHFNVKAYPEEQKITATLLEGAIRLDASGSRPTNESVQLTPNQQAIYTKESGQIRVNTVDAANFTIWKDGQFYFQREHFADIVRQLERNFQVKIKIHSPKIAAKVYSGQFDHGENLNQILDLMRNHQNFTYKINKDSIDIY